MFAQLIGPDGLIILVVVAVLMIFGGSKLPGLARAIGSSSHEFRKGLEAGQGGTADPAAGGEEQSTQQR